MGNQFSLSNERHRDVTRAGLKACRATADRQDGLLVRHRMSAVRVPNLTEIRAVLRRTRTESLCSSRRSSLKWFGRKGATSE